MYTRRVFPLRGMLIWTRRYIFIFLLISLIPVILFDVLGWKWLHLPWLPIGLLGTAVAFIAGFKNNASYDRLWEARKIWGGIVNASRSWTIMVKDFITNDRASKPLPDEELQAIHQELVHRHIAWLTALRYQLRQPKPWEDHLKTKKENVEFRRKAYDIPEDMLPLEEAINPYISPAEKQEIFAKGNRASQLLGVQSRRLRQLKQQGYIEDFRHMEMENMLVEFYTLQGKSERIKNFPYPRQFATLNFLFVWIFIILVPFGIMNEFESIGQTFIQEMQGHSHEAGFFHTITHIIGHHFVWLSIPFSALIAWVFYCIELIGENTENPFEGGPNDVPITNMSRGIEIDIRQLIDDTNIPKAYQWRNDIIM
ncbi:MAG: bestrophin family ion channel [Bacteroidota bacterium]